MTSAALVFTAVGVWGGAAVWLSIIDFRTRTLPPKIIWVAALIVWALLSSASLVESDSTGLVGIVMGGLICGAPLAALHFVKFEWMGFGDVRLAALNGLVCGWWGWRVALFGLATGFVAALPIAVWTIIREGTRVSKPLGPFLVIGAGATIIRATLEHGPIPF